MPFHAATMIVDAFFLDGAVVIFRVALAILRENEQKVDSFFLNKGEYILAP
jgi:hypothetical protein